MRAGTALKSIPAQAGNGRRASGIAKIFYGLAALGALAGVFEMYVGINLATSAPQQAASTAMASAYAILPHVLARAVEELSG